MKYKNLQGAVLARSIEFTWSHVRNVPHNELKQGFVLSFCAVLNYTVKLSDTLHHLLRAGIVPCDVQ